jgi:lipopolysaccharide export system protein LptC
MRSKGSWLLFILAVVALCLAGWTGNGQKQSTKLQRSIWEYKIVQGTADDAQLNQLGSEGWELLAVAVANDQVSYYFKRAK